NLGQIEADRPHRGTPVDADASRRTQGQVIDDIGVGHTVAADQITVIQLAQSTDIGKQAGTDAVLFGQAVRQGQFDRTDGIEVTAQSIGRGQVARAHTGRFKATEALTTLEEAVVDADRVTTPAGDITDRALNTDHPVRTD